MKTKQTIVCGFLAVILALAFTACSKSGGGSGSGSGSGGGDKSINSATELKEYLDKQPANSTDNPIKVAMKANDMMIGDIGEVIKNAGKYVSLDLSGSPLTEIPGQADYWGKNPGPFQNCKTLVGIIIPDSVTSIGDRAFQDSDLTSITIPNSVTSIGESAFKDCTSLASITLPNSVTSMGISLFVGCTSLASITLPNSITSIGDFAFVGCTSLTSITIPNSVTSIGGLAFANCDNLASVTIPASVTTVGEYAFRDWTSSQTINIEGYASQAAADNAWRSSWRTSCSAVRKYWNGTTWV